MLIYQCLLILSPTIQEVTNKMIIYSFIGIIDFRFTLKGIFY